MLNEVEELYDIEAALHENFEVHQRLLLFNLNVLAYFKLQILNEAGIVDELVVSRDQFSVLAGQSDNRSLMPGYELLYIV